MSIYNETAIRQGRKFWHYGKDFASVQKENGTYAERSLFLAAFLEGQMIGYMKIVLDEDTAAIMQILSKMEFYDKRPNNALMAAGVRECCSRGIKHLLYEKYVYEGKPDSSLTEYKKSNGFIQNRRAAVFRAPDGKGFTGPPAGSEQESKGQAAVLADVPPGCLEDKMVRAPNGQTMKCDNGKHAKDFTLERNLDARNHRPD